MFLVSEKRKGNLVVSVSRRCDHVSVEEMRWIMPRQTWFSASYTLSTISNCQCLAGQSGGRVMMWWVVFLLVGRGAARQAVRSFSFYVVVCWIFYSVNLIKALRQLLRVGGSKSYDENHCFHWCLLCDTVTSSCGCFWTSFSVLLSSIDKLPVGWTLRSLFFFLFLFFDIACVLILYKTC